MPRKPINICAAISGMPQPVKIPNNQSAATLRGSFQKFILRSYTTLESGGLPPKLRKQAFAFQNVHYTKKRLNGFIPISLLYDFI
jgi:hypothetical protein